MKEYKVRSADATTEIDIPVSTRYNQWMVNITYYVDNTFAATATPSAGTVAVTGRTAPQEWITTFNASALDATVPLEAVSVSGKLDQVTVTPSGITGAGAFEVTIIGTD
jgi:hypothetical protein